MARTPSTMLALQTPLPAFALPAARGGKTVTSEELLAQRKGLLVSFMCNHCPFVIHVRKVWLELSAQLLEKGMGCVAINSNSTKTHPQDGPAAMERLATEEAWPFPFLFDETQDVAHGFSAACTPDFFLFDGEGKLYYRGQMDDSRPGNGIAVTGKDLRAAAEALLAGKPAPADQIASLGCGIKWHP